jgi:hypothetical protein
MDATVNFRNLLAEGTPGRGILDIIYRSERVPLYPEGW